jgi:hypothetical protein
MVCQLARIAQSRCDGRHSFSLWTATIIAAGFKPAASEN